MTVYSREATSGLYSLDDLLNDLSLAHEGRALEVSGPFADFFGEYHVAALPDQTQFRVERNGFVKKIYRKDES